jgi:hypothetical protein
MFAPHIAVAQLGGVLLRQADGPQRGGCKTAVCHIFVTSQIFLEKDTLFLQNLALHF